MTTQASDADLATQAPEAPIGFTDRAVAKIRELMSAQPANAYLRIGVRGGGCAGMSYQMELKTDDMGKKDQAFEVLGITVVSDVKSLLYLTGLSIDYSTDLIGGGFKFVNPNAMSTCGCGTSFSV
ncbi:MAG: iron-sulfur cluster assembly accessory protein [Candidatus Schekmanbacteria bacterium]|nr:iron-sulfur cluster assembly accessory protein [Candidatus Schekmanbacteria bacterium]